MTGRQKMHQAVIWSEDETVEKGFKAYLESKCLKVRVLKETELKELSEKFLNTQADGNEKDGVFFVIPSLNPHDYVFETLPLIINKRAEAVNAALALHCERLIDVGDMTEDWYRQFAGQRDFTSSMALSTYLTDPLFKKWVTVGATLLTAYETTCLLTYQRRLNYLHTQSGILWNALRSEVPHRNCLKVLAGKDYLSNDAPVVEELLERLYTATVKCVEQGSCCLWEMAHCKPV